ncbi:hypothetical protein [Citrobacter braakii]|uniref:hypothetical protein n=1 Tax=Citrobacter braakii TaxID=57706 RepID=UPI00397A4172
MAKVRVRKIRHPGGSETFQSQDPITGEWTDVFIRVGDSAADVEDYNKRVSEWIKSKERNGVEVIEVPNY